MRFGFPAFSIFALGLGDRYRVRFGQTELLCFFRLEFTVDTGVEFIHGDRFTRVRSAPWAGFQSATPFFRKRGEKHCTSVGR